MIFNKDTYFLADNFYTKILTKTCLLIILLTQTLTYSGTKIYIDNNGFSSFQSEYPYSMVIKNGNIVSSESSLANIEADHNYILLRNVFMKPIEEIFYAYLVDYKSRKIEEKFELYTNNTNLLEIKKEFIRPEIFVMNEHLGIPCYLLKNFYLEYTHLMNIF